MVEKVAYFPEVKPSGVVSRATKERGKQRNEVLPRENKPFFTMAYIIFFYFYNIRFKSMLKTVFRRIIKISDSVSIV